MTSTMMLIHLIEYAKRKQQQQVNQCGPCSDCPYKTRVITLGELAMKKEGGIR